MDETLIFTKTPRGSAEVTLRVGGLSLQERRVLIMIDGTRSLGELAPLVPDGGIDDVIGMLQSRGMIRSVEAAELPAPGPDLGPATAVPPARPSEMPAPPIPVRSQGPPTNVLPPQPEDRIYLTVDEVKRRAVRELNDRLGPDAMDIAMRIERSTSAEELRERLREAERLVARTVSETSAQEFVRAMRRR